MKILVTGASGTVGGLLAQALADSGHSVSALVRDPATYDAPKGVEVVRGDLTRIGDV